LELQTHLKNQKIYGFPKQWFGQMLAPSFLSRLKKGAEVYCNNHKDDAKIAFVDVGSFNSNGSSLQDVLPDSGELLEAAITKGMKFGLDQVCFLGVTFPGAGELKVVSNYLTSLKP